MLVDEFEKDYRNIPNKSGIYKYINKQGEVIYVGKAKNLKKRINSYFKNDNHSVKTQILVKSIFKIEFIIVDNEHDAFILENNLIKKLQPRYNISLKDDKTFPYVVIKNEPFPRVFLTRNKVNDGSEYIGPFTNVILSRFVLNFVKEHYFLRTCNLNLSAKNIAQRKFKVCLEYHIKKCKGPCEEKQGLDDYNKNIEEIKMLIKNNFKDVIQEYKKKMYEASYKLNFELAQSYKIKLKALEDLTVKTNIESKLKLFIDVFGVDNLDNIFFITFLKIRLGKIMETKIIRLETMLNESIKEILVFGIENFYANQKIDVVEIVVPFDIHISIPSLLISVPERGDKKKFLDFATKNSSFCKQELQKRQILYIDNNTQVDNNIPILEELQKDLKLTKLPVTIECFDNSNFQGYYPVSAMVSFKYGMEDKNNYRVFKIKTVKGIDDFATMREVIYRRYRRVKEENLSMPDLIIIDGGKGQLNAAIDSLKNLDLINKVNIIGLAKKNEEIFSINSKIPLLLDNNSKSLKLIKQIRDEVHRFTITFHRKLRLKGTIKTSLMNINGIGDSTSKKLLKHFKSVDNIKSASETEISKIVGPSKAKTIKSFFAIN